MRGAQQIESQAVTVIEGTAAAVTDASAVDTGLDHSVAGAGAGYAYLALAAADATTLYGSAGDDAVVAATAGPGAASPSAAGGDADFALLYGPRSIDGIAVRTLGGFDYNFSAVFGGQEHAEPPPGLPTHAAHGFAAPPIPHELGAHPSPAALIAYDQAWLAGQQQMFGTGPADAANLWLGDGFAGANLAHAAAGDGDVSFAPPAMDLAAPDEQLAAYRAHAHVPGGVGSGQGGGDSSITTDLSVFPLSPVDTFDLVGSGSGPTLEILSGGAASHPGVADAAPVDSPPPPADSPPVARPFLFDIESAVDHLFANVSELTAAPSTTGSDGGGGAGFSMVGAPGGGFTGFDFGSIIGFGDPPLLDVAIGGGTVVYSDGQVSAGSELQELSWTDAYGGHQSFLPGQGTNVLIGGVDGDTLIGGAALNQTNTFVLDGGVANGTAPLVRIENFHPANDSILIFDDVIAFATVTVGGSTELQPEFVYPGLGASIERSGPRENLFVLPNQAAADTFTGAHAALLVVGGGPEVEIDFYDPSDPNYGGGAHRYELALVDGTNPNAVAWDIGIDGRTISPNAAPAPVHGYQLTALAGDHSPHPAAPALDLAPPHPHG